jgi:transposase
VAGRRADGIDLDDFRKAARNPFACSAGPLATLTAYRQGESDLVHRDGNWFLIATCDVPEPEVPEPGGFLGVDLGIVNIATTSDGQVAASRPLNRYRKRQQALRGKLQAKGTKSAKRLLKNRAGKEARFARDANHCIAKKIVTEAERTCRGIALEDLTGIRDRARRRKPRGGGVVAHADRNASRNIAARGQVAWGAGRELLAPAPPSTGRGWTRQPASQPVMP